MIDPPDAASTTRATHGNQTALSDEDRKGAAAAAEEYCAGRLSAREFYDQFRDATDNDIDDLVYLIDHERRVGGFFGVSMGTWQTHRSQVEELISKLQAG